jgi:hypothetical protein
MKNLKEAKELLEKYESITLEEIERTYLENQERHYLFDGHDVLNKLVGFGDENTCMLCKAVQGECDNCIYKFREREGFAIPPCVDLIYREICDSFNPKDTFKALQKRISYLEHVIQYYEYQNC